MSASIDIRTGSPDDRDYGHYPNQAEFLSTRLRSWGIIDPIELVESCIKKGYLRRPSRQDHRLSIAAFDQTSYDIALRLTDRTRIFNS